MKSITTLFLLALLAFPCLIYSQTEVREGDPQQNAKAHSEMEFDIMLKSGRLLLRQIDEFPYNKIFDSNENITNLSISKSPNLSFLTPDIENFKKLRNLDISDTKLKEMPKGIFKLSELQVLSYRKNQTSKIQTKSGIWHN